ncbi:Variant-specific surface protein, partial [Giardia duodenalis]
VGALAAECNASGSQKSECTASKCETLGETEVCTQCQTGGKVPIDGVCKTRTDPEVAAAGCTKTGGTDLTDTEKSCEQCGTGYFLHSGGCYSTAEGKPGRALCTTAGEGVCTQGAEGYFAVPGAVKTGESVVACGDSATGVTVTDNTYKGIANCATCQPPASVAAARADKFAVCDTCLEGFFRTDTSTCTACGGTNCATCTVGTTPKMCTKCKATGNEQYLKRDANTEVGECVTKDACIADTNYYADDTIDPTNGKTCSTCASAGTTGCKTCAKTDGVVACASCEDSQKFGLGKKSCITECLTNSQAGADSVCVCNDGFTPSTDSTACVATSSSVNLSTGAIAGISVAAVVVVGGLVGFLCWWFICRGKA